MSHRGNGFTGVGGAFFGAFGGLTARLARRRELLVRSGGRVRYVALPVAAQVAAILLVAAAGWWVAHTTYLSLGYQRIIAGKNGEIERMAAANRALRDTIAGLRSRYSDVAGTQERNRARIAGLVAQNDGLQRDLGRLRAGLSRADGVRAAGEANQAALRRQLGLLESRLTASEKRSAELGTKFEATRTALADAKRTQSATASSRDTFRQRVAKLEKRLSALRDSQHLLVSRVSRKTERDIARIEHIIAGIGLNANRLLAHAGGSADDSTAANDATTDVAAAGGSDNGQGGPFIPYDRGKADVAEPAPAADTARITVALKDYNRRVARWEDLRRLLFSLPLAIPLDHFHLSSGFGKRRDPFNHRLAMHEGVDLATARGSSVHATAAGRVVFAGRDGRYGRMVEIDHGYGIHTAYAHLSRISVKRNQMVGLGQKVGEVGNSGRSTGPHLHYGIRVDGKWFDPERFIKAGRDVFKG